MRKKNPPNGAGFLTKAKRSHNLWIFQSEGITEMDKFLAKADCNPMRIKKNTTLVILCVLDVFMFILLKIFHEWL